VTKTPHKSGSIKPSIAEALEGSQITELPNVHEESIERTPYVPPHSHVVNDPGVSHPRPDPASDARGMDFGDAIRCLKLGRRVQRAGWNGKGAYVYLVGGSRFTVDREPLLSVLGAGAEVSYHAHIDMRATDGSVFVWNPNQLDMLAEDWSVVG
jgi:hypothetical protein